MKRTSVAVLLLLQRMLPFSLMILAVFAIAAVVPVAAQQQQPPPPPNSECGMNIAVENCIQMRARQAAFKREYEAKEARDKAKQDELVREKAAQDKAAQEEAFFAAGGTSGDKQSMINFVQETWKSRCRRFMHFDDALGSEDRRCFDRQVNSERLRRFQFIRTDSPTDDDYGWLVEFANVEANTDACEAKKDCLVWFVVSVKGGTGWWISLESNEGNLQSFSQGTMVDPSSKVVSVVLNGHTCLLDTKSGLYYDYTLILESQKKEEEAKQQEAKKEAQAKAEEQKARAAFRAAPLPDQNTKPITVVVEKTYLNTSVASGSPLGLWAEVRISAEDAKRLHDPIGVPKNLAWHLVPEKADGRLRFAIICSPNRKDCLRLNPGETYTLELMSQYDSAGARGNLDKRFVRVNGVGVYVVGDYSSEVN